MALPFNQPRRTRMFRSAERQRQRVRRRYLIAMVVAGFLAIGLTAVAARKNAAEALLAWSIQTEDGYGLEVSVEKLTTTHFIATGLSLGADGPRLERLEAQYTLPGLLDGTADLLIVKGLAATVLYDGDSISVPGVGALSLSAPNESSGADVSLNAIIPFKQLNIEATEVRYETPYGAGRLSLDLTGRLEGTQLSAAGQLEASFQDRDLLTAQIDYNAQTAAAEILFAGDWLEISDSSLKLRPEGAFVVRHDGLQTQLSAMSPVSVAWQTGIASVPEDGSTQTQMPPALPFDEGQLTLTSLNPDGARLLEVTRTNETLAADLSLSVIIRGNTANAAADIDFTLAGTGLADLGATDVRTIDAQAETLRLFGATWSGNATLNSLLVKEDFADAGLAVDLQWTEAETSALRMASGALSAAGTLRRRGQDITLDVASGGLTARDMLMADGFGISGETLVSIIEDEPLRLRIREDQTIEASGLFSLAPTEIRIGQSPEFTAQVSAPSVKLSGVAGDGTSVDVTWEGLAFASEYARLTQSVGTATWTAGMWDLDMSAQLRRLMGETPQAALRRLSVSAASESRTIGIQGQLGVQNAPDILEFAGELTETDEGLLGQIRVRAPERAYAPSETPANLIHDRLAPLSGLMAASADINVSPSEVTSSFQLILDDAAWQSESFTAEGVFGVVNLDQLWPPESETPQTLAVRSLEAGVPLENGLLRLTFPGGGLGEVDQGGFDFAGGRLDVEPFDFTLQPLNADATVTGSGIQADLLGEMFGVEGLQASGTLEGRLPLSIRDGEIFLENGFLRASQDGALVYQPAVPPAALAQGSASLMLDALENFQYDRLALSIDGPLDGDLTAAVALSGKNPDLYGGYPFELNVTIDGALGQIARQGVSTFAVPDQISQDIQKALADLVP